MKKIVDVNTGGVEVSSDGVILRSIAIGSCIAQGWWNFCFLAMQASQV